LQVAGVNAFTVSSTNGITIGANGGVAFFLPNSEAFVRDAIAVSTDVTYIDFPRVVFRDPSNGFAVALSIINGATTHTGTVSANSGANVVYRCTTAGTLPIGALTITTADCGASSATGFLSN
jgi:hypothetical protein